MAKFYGKIGYGKTRETKPGVWTTDITEREVYGDIYKQDSRNEKQESVNDNINIAMQISFLADPYAFQNFQHIKYAEYLGNKWKVTTVTPEFPRLLIVLGGVYNEH